VFLIEMVLPVNILGGGVKKIGTYNVVKCLLSKTYNKT